MFRFFSANFYQFCSIQNSINNSDKFELFWCFLPLFCWIFSVFLFISNLTRFKFFHHNFRFKYVGYRSEENFFFWNLPDLCCRFYVSKLYYWLDFCNLFTVVQSVVLIGWHNRNSPIPETSQEYWIGLAIYVKELYSND